MPVLLPTAVVVAVAEVPVVVSTMAIGIVGGNAVTSVEGADVTGGISSSG